MASSTYALLLFGSPENALDSVATISSVELDDLTDTPAMKSMKRDARWLQVTNQQFREMEPSFKITYFRELAAEGLEINPSGAVSDYITTSQAPFYFSNLIYAPYRL
jgi:hypothetical protein